MVRNPQESIDKLNQARESLMKVLIEVNISEETYATLEQMISDLDSEIKVFEIDL